MQTLTCPKCGAILNFSDRVPGSRITCTCKNVVIVPGRVSKQRPAWVYALMGLGALGVLCPCVGLVMVLFVPHLLGGRYQDRSKQGECKANLKAWYELERAFYTEHDVYLTSPMRLGFSPERGNRYAYFAGSGPLEDRSAALAVNSNVIEGIGVDTARYPGPAVILERLPASVVGELGISGECPLCEVTLACAGNIDRDEALDVWTISTGERKRPDGTVISRGEPFHEVDDLVAGP